MSNPFFTVVIACYQTEPYLGKALDSVARQTFRDFEAICYVEESTDRSLEICHAFASRDSRFIVATGPKSGAVATTRNYGIDHAQGEYLVVLDGDDWLVPDMLETIRKRIDESGHIDVISFAAATVNSDDADISSAAKITNFRPEDSKSAMTGRDAIRLTGRHRGSMDNYTWLSCYRTAFLRENGLRQTDGLVMEDMESTPRIWFLAKCFAYIDKILYVYRRRQGSITTQRSSRLAFDLVRQVRSLLEFSEQNDIPFDIRRIWWNQWISLVYWFFFHPNSSKKVPDDDKAKALRLLLKGNGRKMFSHAVAHTSLPKRAAHPLLLLASRGWCFPAKFFFRRLYYPLVAWRGTPA